MRKLGCCARQTVANAIAGGGTDNYVQSMCEAYAQSVSSASSTLTLTLCSTSSPLSTTSSSSSSSGQHSLHACCVLDTSVSSFDLPSATTWYTAGLDRQHVDRADWRCGQMMLGASFSWLSFMCVVQQNFQHASLLFLAASTLKVKG